MNAAGHTHVHTSDVFETGPRSQVCTLGRISVSTIVVAQSCKYPAVTFKQVSTGLVRKVRSESAS